MKRTIQTIFFIVAMLFIGAVKAVPMTSEEMGFTYGYMMGAEMDELEIEKDVFISRTELSSIINKYMKEFAEYEVTAYREGVTAGWAAGRRINNEIAAAKKSPFYGVSNKELCTEYGRISTLRELGVTVGESLLFLSNEVSSRINKKKVSEQQCDAFMSEGMLDAYKQVRR